MSVYSVLITSAGTASAINVIKALRRQTQLGIRIVAVDADPLAAGLRLADEFFVVPKVIENNYVSTLLAISKRARIDVLLPIYSREIEVIAAQKQLLAAASIHLLLSDIESVKACNDKLSLSLVAESVGLRVPRIYSNSELLEIKESAFPLFAKPVQGSSSIGAVILRDHTDLGYWQDRNSGLIVQEFVDGEEVTVDVLCNKKSDVLVVSPRLRIATKDGQSVKGVTIEASDFVEPVSTLCKKLEIVGPCNIQFMQTAAGLVLIEINPRYAAGGLMLTVEAGANIPLLAIKETLSLPIDPAECIPRTGIYMSRYWEEVFWTE